MNRHFLPHSLITLMATTLLTAGAMAQPARPKIVIGLMVDQMRWDYLYRFRDRYGPDGFRRLLGQGFSCENTQIDYSPSVTACGHTCVYTGSVPSLTGIVGNDWYDRYRHRTVYCTDDSTVEGLGAEKGGSMSPVNLLITTIGDEMRMATNFKSKVVGIALKDRAAILPAGHTATAAYWFDWASGGFISSTYYMKELPSWVKAFNERPNIARYYLKDWETLYPIDTYTASTADDKVYELVAGQEQRPVFPHHIKGAVGGTADTTGPASHAGKNYGVLRATPFGNNLTIDFVREAIEKYGLGQGDATDLLAVSLTSPDAVGHEYGSNSIEIEDTYLRLDRDLADFLHYLDQRFGKGNYLFFLTADHGVASSPGYSIENRMPGGGIDLSRMKQRLNAALLEKFQLREGVSSIKEWQIYLDREAITTAGIDKQAVENFITGWLLEQPGIAQALPLESLVSAGVPDALKTRLINGYNPRRSGDIAVIPLPGWKEGSIQGADHGLAYPYDTHIPLVWMGWGVRQGATSRQVHMTDIAPTIAAMLHIQMPSGSIGTPIIEVAGEK